MSRTIKNGDPTRGAMARCHKNDTRGVRRVCEWRKHRLLTLAVAALSAATLGATIILSACSSGSSSISPQSHLTLAGNWQFTVASPPDGSFFGGLQGGFLQQSSGSVKGSVGYAVSLSQLLIPCSSGSATITGTITGETVTLTAVAGTQTFTFTGTLSLNSTPVVDSTMFVGETMTGTYSSTAGTAADGAPCGTAQSGLQWTAILVPPITGTVRGIFHSAEGAADLSNQDFPVSGSLTQGATNGASATVTGSLDFSGSDYPCFNTGSDNASVYGQISGDSVTLQIVGTDGSVLGAIGETLGPDGVTGMDLVTFYSAQGGYILNALGPAYLIATSPCPGTTNAIATAGDYGSVCLGVSSLLLGTGNACPQAVTLSPSSLSFPPQTLGEATTLQMTLANTSDGGVNNLTLSVTNLPVGSPVNFSETDSCGPSGAPSQGEPFDLGQGASCFVTIIFDPQQTCATGAVQCPSSVTGTLNVMENLTLGENTHNETLAVVNLTGTGIVADSVSGVSFPHLPWFAGHSAYAAQVIPASFNHPSLNWEHHAKTD